MSADQVETARELYEAFAARDIRAVTELLHPEIELSTPEGTPEEGTYRGQQAVFRHLAELIDPFEDVRIEPEEFVEVRDQVIVVVRGLGRGKGSGLPVDVRFAHLLTIRDGKVVRLRAFRDKAAAIEATGNPRLSEADAG